MRLPSHLRASNVSFRSNLKLPFPMKKLLVCLDGSLYGQSCCQYALWLSQKTEAVVDTLYVSELWQFEAPLVADFGGSLGAQPYMGLTAQLQKIEQDKAGVMKEFVEKAFTDAGMGGHVNFHYRTGVLVDALEEFEKADPAPELLIIGKRGEGANMAKAHLGSNMERVVRATALPCLIANREFVEPAKTLLAYDGSASADKAVAWYASRPAALAHTELHVVTVAKRGEEDKASEQLRRAEEILTKAGLQPVCQMLAGIPADAIAAYQQSQNINFLLMGAYGHSRIRRLLIGSTTTELLQRCRIPTILFR